MTTEIKVNYLLWTARIAIGISALHILYTSTFTAGSLVVLLIGVVALGWAAFKRGLSPEWLIDLWMVMVLALLAMQFTSKR